MIPILYQGNEQDFLHNGLGRLSDAISCKVTEEHNGVFELEMTYPITGIHYADIKVGMIIFAKTEEGGNNQAFIIYKISRPLNGVVTINAEHISYLLNGFVVMPFTGASCADTFSQIASHMAVSTPFSFYTDIDSSIRYTLSEPRTARNVLGGQKGSILDVYGGGDYKFDNFDVRLLAHRGNDNGVTIRYGKNLTELKDVDDSTNVYTGIVPYWVNPDTGESFYLTEKAVYNEHADDYPYKILRCIDFSSDFETQPTQAQLRAAAESYIEANSNSWKINNNIDVSFVNLSQTEEYKDILALERVRLCDTVTIIYEKLGVDVKTKVIKTVYNVLTEKYDKISLGDTTYSLAKAVQQAIDAPTSEDMTSFIQASIDRATKLIQGGLGGHVVFNTNADGEPEEILIMDTDDIMTAVNVIRMNLNGIGFSHDGYDGPFTTAWTVDGHFVADFIDVGNLNASLLTVGTIKDRNNTSYWNLQTGELRIASGAKVGSGNDTIGQAMTDISNLKFDVNALDVQISGIFANYTGEETPTNSNYPASSWTTEDKPLHVGEVYYKKPQDPDPGAYYRYTETSGVYSWEVIDTTDGNYAVVTSEFKQTKNLISTEVASSATAINNSINENFANYVKTTTPTTSNSPASSWTTDALKLQHNGDICYNKNNGRYYKWTVTFNADGSINTANWVQQTVSHKYDLVISTSKSRMEQTENSFSIAVGAERTAREQADLAATYNYTGTTAPTNPWTDADRNHVGEIYYRSDTQQYYVFEQTAANTYAWVPTTPSRAFDLTTTSNLARFNMAEDEILLEVSKSEKRLFANYTGEVTPTNNNYPASSWNTTAKKKAHTGEVYYDTVADKYYAWTRTDTRRRKPGWIKVVFNSSSAISDTDDFVVIAAEVENEVGGGISLIEYPTSYKITGNPMNYHTIYLPDEGLQTLRLYFHSDASSRSYGYKITSIELCNDDSASITGSTKSDWPTDYTYTQDNSYKWESPHSYPHSTNVYAEYDLTTDVADNREIEYISTFSWEEVDTSTTAFATVSSQIRQTAQEISLKVNRGDLISEINLSPEAIFLNTAGRLIITAGNFQLDEQGNITAANASLTGATIEGSLTTGDPMAGEITIDGGSITGYYGGSLLFTIDPSYNTDLGQAALDINSDAIAIHAIDFINLHGTGINISTTTSTDPVIISNGDIQLYAHISTDIVGPEMNIETTDCYIKPNTLYINAGDIYVAGNYAYSGTAYIGTNQLTFVNGICVGYQ